MQQHWSSESNVTAAHAAGYVPALHPDGVQLMSALSVDGALRSTPWLAFASAAIYTTPRLGRQAWGTRRGTRRGTMRCAACGGLMGESARFCSNCGRPVAAGQTTPPRSE